MFKSHRDISEALLSHKKITGILKELLGAQ